MSRLPAALFIVDINKEKIAVAEARKLNIPIFAVVDTNTDPTLVDFAIPANDDASKSISLIVNAMTQAVAEGLNDRRMAREKQAADTAATAAAKAAAAEEAEIKVKAESLEMAEEIDNAEAEKKGKPETKVQKLRDDKGGEGSRPKRTRKTVSKKS